VENVIQKLIKIEVIGQIILMKNRGLKHRFNKDELKSVWCFKYHCLWCLEAGFDCFHHIMSSSSPRFIDGNFNSSILNAYPIHNNNCHLYNPELHKPENEKAMLKRVLDILRKEGYKLKPIDIEFMRNYKEMY